MNALSTEARLDQTNRFLDVLERRDLASLADMLDDEVVWSAPMSPSRDGADPEPTRGRENFLSRLGSATTLMSSARYVDRRITVSADGATIFLQAKGDFVTADGRPYRNVYVFRLDWRDDHIVSWEEYVNPITAIRAFPDRFGHLYPDLIR